MSSTTHVNPETEYPSTTETIDSIPNTNASTETTMNGIPCPPKPTQNQPSTDKSKESETSSTINDSTPDINDTPTNNNNNLPITDNQTPNENTTTDDTNENKQQSTDTQFTIDNNGHKVFTIAQGLTKTLIIENLDGQPVSDHILGRVWINIKGQTKNGNVFIEHLFEENDFVLGQANQPRGIEMAASTMRHGEHAIIEINDIQYSYSKLKCPELCPATKDKTNVDQWPLRFDLIIIDSLPKHKQSQDMTFAEQLLRADELRGRGNKRYQKRRFVTALKFYMKAVQCLDAMQDVNMKMPALHEKLLEKVDELEVKRMQCKCFLNISICQLRLNDHNKGIEYATKAIDIDSKSKKAYMRRGICFYHLGEYERAEEDLKVFDSFSLDDKEKKLSLKWHHRLQSGRKKSKMKEKEIYGGFLNKSSVKRAKLGGLYDDKVDGTVGEADEGFFDGILNGIGYAVESVISSCADCCRKKKEKDY